MAEKPQHASEYNSEQLELVRAVCLYIATKFGDLMENEVVVIGGLVPSLLIDTRDLPEETSVHVGTMDLDVGLKLAHSMKDATTPSPSGCAQQDLSQTKTMKESRRGSDGS
jgi:hypothetical protein